MADQKLRELTETTTLVSTDLAYLVVDPDGTPLDRKVEVGTLLGNLGAWANLAMNSPGQIITDGSEPQWWDDNGATSTITDEDAAGEGIPDKTSRVFKVVTTADDVYGYQTLTFANESLLDAGQTVVSFSCWVYCAAASTASIGIYGTNLGLEESSQHPGDSAWHLLTVENITLDAADTSIQLRLIVDTGTAYFTMPMLNVGGMALPWMPRGEQFVPTTQSTQLEVTVGDTSGTMDCTANTHPLAKAISGRSKIKEPDGTLGTIGTIKAPTTLTNTVHIYMETAVLNSGFTGECSYIPCDDGQNIDYTVAEADADSDVVIQFFINGYWRWAP